MAQPHRASRHRFPVSIAMQGRTMERAGWQETQWQLSGVIANRRGDTSRVERTLIQADGESCTYLWTGLCVELFKDGGEGYWYNLLSEVPFLFVVCDIAGPPAQGGAGAIAAPYLVTADQDEANAHLESDDLVFSVPMPPEVCQWVERFVVEHYEPQVKKKRKRRNWAEESEQAGRAKPRLG